MTDKIVVSLGGSSNLARITKVTHCTWPQFIQFLKKEPRVTEDKASAGWFCPAEFKFNNRDGDSLLARYALTFDYDNITPEDLWQIRKIYECYEHVIYTTASHTPENPRVRIIFPLSRPVDHEEFRCVTRTIGDLFNLTKLAPESDKPAQMVFRPTRAPAGEYWCQHNKRGSVIDVDHVLKRYKNWRDRSQWPLREGESLSSEPGVGESPDEKLGIVGEFCRAYRVPEAIERFGLPYTRGSTDTRYTYDEGSRPDGLRIYDDGLKAHSDHATDPANGQTNAFDLVRLHKYGKLDTEDDLDQPITERPSYREMTRFAMELPEIRQALVAREFSNLDDDLPPPEKKVKTLAVPLEDLLQNPTRPRWLIRNELERGVIALMAGPRGTYKAQPLDEDVLTPDGWVPMWLIEPGDYVIGSNGFPVKVLQTEAHPPRAEWVVTFSNGAKVRCADDHLWRVRVKGDRWQVLSTKELYEKRQKSKYPLRTAQRVPLVQPVQYSPNRNPLPLDPYLLGALLGDGNTTDFVAFSSADEEIIAEIRARLPAGHEIKQIGVTKYAYRIVVKRGQCNHVWTALRLLGIAGCKSVDKVIPEEYMRASPADRMLLLQGLMDTDGHATARSGKICEIRLSNLQMINQVRELVGSLGGVANKVRTYKTTHSDAHAINFRMPIGSNPFRLTRKAERLGTPDDVTLKIADIRPTNRVVPMQCLSVAAPDGCYVTSDFVVTHNSFIALDWAMRTVMRNLGPVYVLSAEGADFDRRATAWLKTFAPDWTAGEKPAGLYVAQARIDLNQHDNIELVRQDCINKHNIRPVLFVLDTFSKLSGALDENSNTEVKSFIGRIDNGLKRPFDATVLMVTHTGHGEKTRARGASALEADTDAAYVVSRHNGPNNLVSLSRERFKSSPELDPLTLRPEIVTLGYKDDEGELVSSIVLYPDNTPTQPTRSEPKGLYAQSVWQAAHETLKQGPRTVRFLVDYAANKLTPPEGRDTRRQNCSRAVQKLVVEGFLHKHANDHVSLTTAVAVDEEDWMDE